MKKRTKAELVDLLADLMEENKTLKDKLDGMESAFRECWKRGRYYQIKYEKLKGKKK